MPDLVFWLISVVMMVWALMEIGGRLIELVSVVGRIHVSLERLTDVLEATRTDRAQRPQPAADAAVEPAAHTFRTEPLPPLNPRAIAPAITRPPRPAGGFGSKSG